MALKLLKRILGKKAAPVRATRKLEYGDHNRPCTCHGPGDDWYELTGTKRPEQFDGKE